MDLQIFKVGFEEKEFNEFCNNNIVYKWHVLETGAVFVFYKPTSQLGYRKVEEIETLDRLTKQAQDEILVHELEKEVSLEVIADTRAEMKKHKPTSQEFKKLEQIVLIKENAVLMADSTITERKRQISAYTSHLKSI